ncbi:MAG: hypothetical protein M1821_009440 [Bathelium mastoideum]|nr:MAG: hypothetical protein M1821_009440 [Bathelium mastoideum]
MSYQSSQLVDGTHSDPTSQVDINGNGNVVRALPDVPSYRYEEDWLLRKYDSKQDLGTARANLAISMEKPDGTTEGDWAARNQHRTVLQQHCLFFDSDDDGVIWPRDTFLGFHKLGFGITLSLLATFIIHANFSYPTLPTFFPDPFLRVHIQNIHKDKHGSDSGTYDTEGRFIPQKFEDMFSKYADGKDYMTIWDISRLMKGQRCIVDPIGWGAQFFECKIPGRV